MARHVEVLGCLELAWPGEPEACFGHFYGAKAALAAGKASQCGGGKFLAVIVRDRRPRYGWRVTSRGSENVNLRLFAMKSRYRAWTGGGHLVHTTNSPAEARRDIFLLTGQTLADWERGVRPKAPTVLPGYAGWASLRDLFAVLNETAAYVVLRNFELLPDAFDPSLHGDIDLLVVNETEVAGLLGARKVFPEPWRVHYEVMVGGVPLRLDLRSVGDGYYDARWQRDVLKRSVVRDGVRLPAPEDAFYLLVYHALLQKRAIADDYPAKIARLAEAAGRRAANLDDAFLLLDDFLAAHRYQSPTPRDRSVFFDSVLARAWRNVAAEIEEALPVTDLRPARLGERQPESATHRLSFAGRGPDGDARLVAHDLANADRLENEWRRGRAFAKLLPEACVRPLAYHAHPDGSATLVSEWLAGQTLASAVRDGNVAPCEAARWANEIDAIAEALQKLGLCHRAVCLENLIVDQSRHIRLTNFRLATDLYARHEDPFVLENWRGVLAQGLGDASLPGIWNDWLSSANCIRALPAFDGRDRLLSQIERKAQSTFRPLLLRGRRLKKCRRDALRLRLKNFCRALLGKKPVRLDRLKALTIICNHKRENNATADI